MSLSNDNGCKGRASLQAHLDSFYPDMEPLLWVPMISRALGGADPLDAISAYEVPAPLPHRHYVSFGMSELYDKVSDIPEQSGWGYEFTMRIAASSLANPGWACVPMQDLARYVFQTGNTFSADEHVDFQRPLCAEFSTGMSALILVEDAVLGAIDTPNGRVQFLQMFAITADEVDAVRSWSLTKVVELFRRHNPLLISDMHRASLLSDPEMRMAIRKGIHQDGSSCEFYYFNDMKWVQADGAFKLVLAAKEAEAFQNLLCGRLQHGRPAEIGGGGGQLTVLPADRCAFEVSQADSKVFSLYLTPAAVRETINILSTKNCEVELKDIPSLKVRVNR